MASKSKKLGKAVSAAERKKLTARAQQLTKQDLESLLHGEIKDPTIKKADTNSVRKVALMRILSGKPVYCYKNLNIDGDDVRPDFCY